MCPLGNPRSAIMSRSYAAWWRECGLCARLETVNKNATSGIKSINGGNAGYVPAWKPMSVDPRTPSLLSWRECGLCARLETLVTLRHKDVHIMGWRECGLCARLETEIGNKDYSILNISGGNAGYVPAWKRTRDPGRKCWPKNDVEGMRAMCPLGNVKQKRSTPNLPLSGGGNAGYVPAWKRNDLRLQCYLL